MYAFEYEESFKEIMREIQSNEDQLDIIIKFMISQFYFSLMIRLNALNTYILLY